jgi:aspartyl protease family protein
MGLSRHCILAILLFLFSAGATATDVNVVGLFPGKVLVEINGGAPRVISAGQKTAEGVTLISTDSGADSATLSIDGKTRTLKRGQQYASPSRSSSAQSVTLTANPQGHFVLDGQINGGSMRFLLDTGATMVALSAGDAGRLGIDYRKGERGLISTANGVVGAYRVKLDSVKVGDITADNVDGVVMEGNSLPIALLGMSFLNRMEMKRDGQTMVLTKRF